MGVTAHAGGDRLNGVERRPIQVLLIRQLRQLYRLATQLITSLSLERPFYLAIAAHHN